MRLVHDLGASFRITRWAYEQTWATGGRVWLKARKTKDLLVPLDPAWRELPEFVA